MPGRSALEERSACTNGFPKALVRMSVSCRTWMSSILYNTCRTHRSLDKDTPVSRPVQQNGRIVSRALVGGLHHQYVRI